MSNTWFIKEDRRNCGKCEACQADPSGKPHGPYTEIRRRNGKGYDIVYLGSVKLEPNDIERINAMFTAEKPTKQEVGRFIIGEIVRDTARLLTSSHNPNGLDNGGKGEK